MGGAQLICVSYGRGKSRRTKALFKSAWPVAKNQKSPRGTQKNWLNTKKYHIFYTYLQKFVSDIDLANDYDQVQKLTKKENERVSIVFVLQIVSEGSQKDLQLFIWIFYDSVCTSFG